jgi:hypothetical protein
MLPGVGTRASVTKLSGVEDVHASPSTDTRGLAQAEFSLSDNLREEVTLVQDHLDDHVMMSEMTQVLTTPGPSGGIGELTVEGMVTDEVCLTVHKAELTRPKSEEAVALLESTKVVRDLRVALRDGDWAQVDVVLARVHSMDGAHLPRTAPGAPGAPLGGPGPTFGRSLLPQCLTEVLRVREEVNYREVMAELTTALSTGSVGGTVGALSPSTIRLEALVAAISTAGTILCPTDESRYLLALAKINLEVRKAVIARDWDSVETFLHSSADLFGPPETLPPKCQAPGPCAAEFALLRAEVDDRRVQEALRAALATGGPVGDIGHLNVGVVEVAGLEAGLELALQLGARSAPSRALVATASMIRGLRRSLVARKWEVVGAIIDHVTRRADAEPTGAGAPGQGASGPVSLASLWTLDLDVLDTGVAPEGAKELDLMCEELKNRNILLHLTAALGSGMATGAVGEMDTSKVDVSALDWAISYAKRMEVHTLEASHLLTTAQLVRKLRAALVAGDWRRLEQVGGRGGMKVEGSACGVSLFAPFHLLAAQGMGTGWGWRGGSYSVLGRKGGGRLVVKRCLTTNVVT